jgi:hypothetical protein
MRLLTIRKSMISLHRGAQLVCAMAITLQLAFLFWSHSSLSSTVSAQEAPSCGAGQYEEVLTSCDQGIALPWKGTPEFSCGSGNVADAQVLIYHNNTLLAENAACYNVGWNSTGWFATEKWTTEEERVTNGCEKITRAQVSWSCSCAAPSPTPTPSGDATPSASMEPTPSPTPEPLPSITPVPCIPERSPVPSPTPRPTPTPDVPGVGGGSDDEEEEVVEEVYEEEVYAETGMPSDALLALPGMIGVLLTAAVLKQRK